MASHFDIFQKLPPEFCDEFARLAVLRDADGLRTLTQRDEFARAIVDAARDETNASLRQSHEAGRPSINSKRVYFELLCAAALADVRHAINEAHVASLNDQLRSIIGRVDELETLVLEQSECAR